MTGYGQEFVEHGDKLISIPKPTLRVEFMTAAEYQAGRAQAFTCILHGYFSPSIYFNLPPTPKHPVDKLFQTVS